jgi:hypothetical protein
LDIPIRGYEDRSEGLGNDTGFVMERRSFVPKRDLSVLFITGLDAAGSDD